MTKLIVERSLSHHRCYRRLESPLGEILIAGNGEAISLLSFLRGSDPVELAPEWEERPTAFAEAARQVGAYFRGELEQFDLEVRVSGTPFQTSVWRALLEIPYGKTVSYSEIATRIGNRRAVRAVGSANSLNPVPLIIPCHRVIGKDGELTGYRGGVLIKRNLIELELAGIERRIIESAV